MFGGIFPGIIFAIGQQHDRAALGMFVVQPIRRRGHGRANRGAIFHQPNSNALQILHKPVMIQRHRADDIGPAGKSNEADAIVRPTFDELAGYFANGVKARRAIAADGEIFRQHRARNIEHEHDVDPARLDLGQTFPELRPRQRNDENGETSRNSSDRRNFPARAALALPIPRKDRGR